MDKSCSLAVHFDKGRPALATEIKESLEAIMFLLNGGEFIPQFFYSVIRYLPT
ncbi:coatomer subunit beta-1-like [Trifolium medium]|uniref:Coatomer subunit beta-1-like n=1 Tax=Trifolium medium TaxID=97028 RepID=A0A392VJS7_9FABA|nr:coatomer subunit beta-1-like [Trifolium medium]